MVNAIAIEALLLLRVRRDSFLKVRQDVGGIANWVAFASQLIYQVPVHRIIARSEAIHDSVDTLIIVVHFSGGLVMEVFCRGCYYPKKSQEEGL